MIIKNKKYYLKDKKKFFYDIKYLKDNFQSFKIYKVEKDNIFEINKNKKTKRLFTEKEYSFIKKFLNVREGEKLTGQEIIKNRIKGVNLNYYNCYLVAPKWYRKIENKIFKNKNKEILIKALNKGNFEDIGIIPYKKNANRYY